MAQSVESQDQVLHQARSSAGNLFLPLALPALVLSLSHIKCFFFFKKKCYEEHLPERIGQKRETLSRKEGRQQGTRLGQSKKNREFQKGEYVSLKVTETSDKVETEQKPLDLRKSLLTFIGSY